MIRDLKKKKKYGKKFKLSGGRVSNQIMTLRDEKINFNFI